MMQIDLENFLSILRLRVASTTFERKAWQIKSFITFLQLNNFDYSNLKKEIVQKYLLSLGCCQSTIRQHCLVIGEFYTSQKLKNPIKDIVFRSDKSVKVPSVPSQIVMKDIVKKISADDSDLSLRNRLVVELAYGSGLRRAELTKLNIDDIDLENRTVYIHGKGGKNRIVPLTRTAVSLIRKFLAERSVFSGSLFVSAVTQKRLSVQSIYWIFKNKFGVRPHQLRHACAGHMLKNGCSTRVIQELLGHKDLRATQVYTKIYRKDLSEIINTKHPLSL